MLSCNRFHCSVLLLLCFTVNTKQMLGKSLQVEIGNNNKKNEFYLLGIEGGFFHEKLKILERGVLDEHSL